GGGVVSVAAHLTIIGAITATAAHSRSVKSERPQAVLVRFDHPPPPPKPVDRPTTRATIMGPTTFSPVTIHHVEAPPTVPVTLPAIDSSFGSGSASIVIGHGPSGSPLARGLFDDGDKTGNSEWSGAELATRILSSAKPRYPESLRQAAIDGTVLV